MNETCDDQAILQASYKAVIGPKHQSAYLQYFSKADALGRVTLSWHWMPRPSDNYAPDNIFWFANVTSKQEISSGTFLKLRCPRANNSTSFNVFATDSLMTI